MSTAGSRRGFLRDLATLPLIGGGVALIGNPTNVAEAASQACIESYLAFLHYEFRWVHEHLYPGYREAHGIYIPVDNAGGRFHSTDLRSLSDWPRVCREAAMRGPLVLSTVGCDWRA